MANRHTSACRWCYLPPVSFLNEVIPFQEPEDKLVPVWEQHRALLPGFVSDFARLAEGFSKAGIPRWVVAGTENLRPEDLNRLCRAWFVGPVPIALGWHVVSAALLAGEDGTFFHAVPGHLVDLSAEEAAIRVMSFPRSLEALGGGRGIYSQPSDSVSHLYVSDQTLMISVGRWDAGRREMTVRQALVGLIKPRGY